MAEGTSAFGMTRPKAKGGQSWDLRSSELGSGRRQQRRWVRTGAWRPPAEQGQAAASKSVRAGPDERAGGGGVRGPRPHFHQTQGPPWKPEDTVSPGKECWRTAGSGGFENEGKQK